MSAADDLLVLLAAIPGVRSAAYSELQPSDPQPSPLPARRVTCLFTGVSTSYPRAQMCLSDALINDPSVHDQLVAHMTTAVTKYKP